MTQAFLEVPLVHRKLELWVYIWVFQTFKIQSQKTKHVCEAGTLDTVL